MPRRFGLGLAFLLLILWGAITVLGGSLLSDGVPRDQMTVVSQRPLWSILAAALFLWLAVRGLGWPDLAFRRTEALAALRLCWLPLLYLAIFASVLVVMGPPPLPILALVAMNCVFVGFSEEMMFRGVMFGALSSRFRMWTAIWASSLLFGAIHSLNVFGTGNLTIALFQSLAACMTGVFMVALRLRTGSIWPPILLHAFWNFVLITAGLSILAQNEATSPAEVGTAGSGVLALLFMAPLGVYGLYLLRDPSQLRG